MRVIGGKLKGKFINHPLDKNTRPLKDLVRESIFNILEHSNNEKIILKDKIVLDLFSGSGSFGIECISRGVKKVYFFENYKNSIKILKIINKNAYEISINDINCDNIDLIYIDPPFKDKNINILLEKLKVSKIAEKKTLILIHRNKKYKEDFTKEFKIIREKTYGLSKIIFGRILF